MIPSRRASKKLRATQTAHAAMFFDRPWEPGDTLDGRDVMLVSQLGAHRNGHGYGLGMYVLGQALFSAELLHRISKPARLRTAVAVVKDDRAMHAFADEHGIQ